MQLKIHDIPIEAHDWPNWLELQIVGLELAELIEQLTALVAASDVEIHKSLSEHLGDKLGTVMESGLSCLDQKALGYLMKHPQLLGDLQDAIFLRGGDYWLSVPVSEEHRQLSERSRAKFLAAIEAEQTLRADQAYRQEHRRSGSSSIVEESSKSVIAQLFDQMGDVLRSARRNRAPVLAFGVLMLMVVGVWLFRPTTTAGFAPASLLSANVSSTALLKSLADSAPEVESSSSSNLESQLLGFGRDCDRLQRAKLTQLVTADRAWLQERCAAWAKKLDGHLADLRSGTKSVEQVADEANKTITALQVALRARAGAA